MIGSFLDFSLISVRDDAPMLHVAPLSPHTDDTDVDSLLRN